MRTKTATLDAPQRRVRPPSRVAREAAYFVFRLGGRLYALPSHVIVLVAPVQLQNRSSSAPAPLAGAVYVRGRVAMVVDLGLVLGVDGRGERTHDRHQLVLVHIEDIPFAFVVEEARGLRVRPGPLRRGEDAHPPVIARFDDGFDTVAVMDPFALVRQVAGAVEPA